MKIIRTIYLIIVLGLILPSVLAQASQYEISENINGYKAVDCIVDNPDGSLYECYLTGIKGEINEAQLQGIVEAAVKGEKFVIEESEGENDLIDAEKVSILYPDNIGKLVEGAETELNSSFQDSFLCWAASAADMLQYSGWGKLAGFETEDEIFAELTNTFTNEGGTQSEAIGCFFTGIFERVSAGRATVKDTALEGGFLSDYVRIPEYTSKGLNQMLSKDGKSILLKQYEQNDLTEEGIIDSLELLKEGYALGIGTLFGYKNYTDEAGRIIYKDDRGFYEIGFGSVGESELEKKFYVYDGSHDLVFLHDDLSDDQGNTYDVDEVIQAECVNVNGECVPVKINAAGEYDYEYKIYCSDGDLQNLAEQEPEVSGAGHAVTVFGYVIKKNSDGVKELMGIIISDSDNDASYSLSKKSFVEKTERPDKYTMYPVKYLNGDILNGFSLQGYKSETEMVIARMSVLAPQSR